MFEISFTLHAKHMYTNNTNTVLWASGYNLVPRSCLLPLFRSSCRCVSRHSSCASKCYLLCLEKLPQALSISLCDRDSCLNKINRVLGVYVCSLVRASCPWFLLRHSNKYVWLQSTLQSLSRPTLCNCFGSIVQLCSRLCAIPRIKCL